ncbi:MAG: hypothetical protein HGA23_11315 [Bacteroidales bacterium]|nr:hypothetical protein [Bacteroidales bacterium]
MLNLEPTTIISRIIILVIALTIHEFAHAWTADHFGDTTPRAHGRLTLNPAAHLDLMGSLMLIVAAGLYIVSLLFNTWDLFPRLAAKSIIIVSYPFVLYLFRFYEPMELNRIRGGWNKWSNPSELRENIKRLINK